MGRSNASQEMLSLNGEGSTTTISDEVARLEQALLDLAHAESCSVSLTHCASLSRENALVRELSRAARARGFVVASLDLVEHPVDAIETLVAALIDALVHPSENRVGGILRLLDLYFERHGKKTLTRFEEAVELHGAGGDLTALCTAYLSAEDEAKRELRTFDQWAAGELPTHAAKFGVRGALSAQTGQRVLGELSRLVRALGHAGLLIVLTQGDSIATRSARQREKAYTLLRELVDNFDAGRGAVATRIVVTGGDALFVGERSMQELPPLHARLQLASNAEPPPPHRSWTSLVSDPEVYIHRRVRSPDAAKAKHLRSLIRLSQGLPPVDAVAAMSVGHEKVDKTVDKLFHHAEMAGSVFQVLSGEYGSGKTHILLHLAERALADQHPVFWLNLERMNLDLGNPARHFHRVLAQSQLPRKGKPSALDRLAVWTRSKGKLKKLLEALTEIAATESEEAKAAQKALSLVEAADADEKSDRGAALEEFLSGQDLADKSAGKSYRLDAYRRLLLWTELLQRLENVAGPVVLIDEAENLYTSGVPEAGRRAALRSLAFYCGGALPGACVILAMTPHALTDMRKECKALLKEASELNSTLDLEDVDLFRRRLHKLSPDEVLPFTGPMRRELSQKVRQVHKSVRGAVEMEHWDELVKELVQAGGPPRMMMRRLVDELEAAWWGSKN